MEPAQPSSVVDRFRDHWKSSTADDNVTLYGFRRYKTIHLLNLRFLEDEIAKLDHTIYQAGLSLEFSLTEHDRLGLKHFRRDQNLLNPLAAIDNELVKKLRGLLQQYDEALQAFNSIMSMETSFLIDTGQQARQRTDLNPYEIYKTRLLRIDLGQRLRQDPIHRFVRRCLYSFRFRHLSREWGADNGSVEAQGPAEKKVYQNTVLIAEILARFLMAVLIGVFVVVPLTTLSYQPSKEVQLAVICVCIVTFTCLVSTLLKVTSLEMMMVSVAYGAILTVFISNLS